MLLMKEKMQNVSLNIKLCLLLKTNSLIEDYIMIRLQKWYTQILEILRKIN
jgi:hypothetical protein